jgi:hypothetical protein
LRSPARTLGPWQFTQRLPKAATSVIRQFGCVPGAVLLVAFQGPPKLHADAILGSDEIRAEQQQNEVGTFEVVGDLLLPLRARLDHAIMPTFDEAFPS